MNALTKSFDPTDVDSRTFREALGRFGTGVTVVTCETGSGPLGITANSFSSLSLDPPLVMWAPAKNSSRYPFFVAMERFAIHVIARDHADPCWAFARDGAAFDDFDWERSEHGVPLLNTCLSRFECVTHAVHDGGDHSIVVGRVERVTTRPGEPLLFVGGDYGGFDKTS
ncbi:flavin reductase family protein [Primorskyibacter sp. 2E107]|uniref:flavin reductase family protein n=1 Tax=Primorskyibacter sp. 2E107 TaxID=3403458 RepID=UPI003AF9C97F